MTIEAMKQALEALHVHAAPHPMVFRAMDALRLAIEQAQEPVAWKWKERVNNEFDSWVVTASEPPPYAIETHPLYTAPRQWQGLTDEEIDALDLDEDGLPSSHLEFARAIEAKLKERNT